MLLFIKIIDQVVFWYLLEMESNTKLKQRIMCFTINLHQEINKNTDVGRLLLLVYSYFS